MNVMVADDEKKPPQKTAAAFSSPVLRAQGRPYFAGGW